MIFLPEFAAYLMGCPIRGVILDPIVAMQRGIQGQVCLFFLHVFLLLSHVSH